MPNQPVFGTLYTLDRFVYRQNSILLYCTIKEIIILKIACFGVIYVPFSRVITRYYVYFFTRAASPFMHVVWIKITLITIVYDTSTILTIVSTILTIVSNLIVIKIFEHIWARCKHILCIQIATCWYLLLQQLIIRVSKSWRSDILTYYTDLGYTFLFLEYIKWCISEVK